MHTIFWGGCYMYNLAIEVSDLMVGLEYSQSQSNVCLKVSVIGDGFRIFLKGFIILKSRYTN